MLEQLGGTWSPLGVLDQTFGHETLEERAPLARDGRCLTLDDVHDNLMLTLFDIGRISISQLVGENP